MFIILSWFGTIFNLTKFALKGFLMNTMYSDIYCTTSGTDRSKLPKHCVFSDTSQEVSSIIYILALRHLFQRVRENVDILLEQLAPSVLEITCAIYVSL
jgi:hypothetical protein